MSELQKTVDYLNRSMVSHRKAIFWALSSIAMLWLLGAVKEVTSLLLLAYGLAVLIDPLVSRMERYRIPRGASIIGMIVVILGLFVAVLGVAIPTVVSQYGNLIRELPGYVETSGNRVSSFAREWLALDGPDALDDLVGTVKESISAVGVEQLKGIMRTIGKTLLRGYSFTLTIFNLILLPFFVFYIGRDLGLLHRFAGSFMKADVRERVSLVALDILECVYAFFRGQLTVAFFMACLYAVLLTVVGLPWGIAVGVLSGLLNIIPYLGIGIGLVLATIITVVTAEPLFPQLLFVWGAFVVVQVVDGMFLTPKIVGESVGIHPLAVMIALIIGGQLFGLLGLILAVPAAAAVRVLIRYTLAQLNNVGRESAESA